MEYVMYGKLLTHLREHRMKQSSFFNFSKDGGDVGEALTSKDLTKFAYGVAKGMEYLVSKGVGARPAVSSSLILYFRSSTVIWPPGTFWWITPRTPRYQTSACLGACVTWAVRCTSRRRRARCPSGGWRRSLSTSPSSLPSQTSGVSVSSCGRS